MSQSYTVALKGGRKGGEEGKRKGGRKVADGSAHTTLPHLISSHRVTHALLITVTVQIGQYSADTIASRADMT